MDARPTESEGTNPSSQGLFVTQPAQLQARAVELCRLGQGATSLRLGLLAHKTECNPWGGWGLSGTVRAQQEVCCELRGPHDSRASLRFYGGSGAVLGAGGRGRGQAGGSQPQRHGPLRISGGLASAIPKPDWACPASPTSTAFSQSPRSRPPCPGPPSGCPRVETVPLSPPPLPQQNHVSKCALSTSYVSSSALHTYE